MRKKLSIVLVLVLLASAVPMAITPAAAISEVYEEKIAGDADENGELTKEELVSAILPYMLDEGDLELDDAGDAAYVYAYWNGKPKTITDMGDRSVTFYRPLERIVITSADITRVVIALRACDNLIGVGENSCKTSICRACGRSGVGPIASPEECKIGKRCARNVCGGRLFELPQAYGVGFSADPELLVLMKPDVVFIGGSSRAESLQKKTLIPAVSVSAHGHDFENVYNSIEFMAPLLAKENEAEERITFFEEKLDTVRDVISQIPEEERKTAYFGTRGAKHVAIGQRGFTTTVTYHSALEVAGGINVAKDALPQREGSRTINVAREQIIKWNPDVILISCSVPSEKSNLRTILDDPEFQTITAVKNNDVYYILSVHSRGGPGTENFINALYIAKILYPEKFKDLDLEKEGNEIYEAFLGVDDLFSEYADYTCWMREYLDEQQKS